MAIIKTYIANTQKEAFEKARQELGDEAVIVNTRKVRQKGLRGFIQKPAIELTVVVDDLPAKRTNSTANVKDEIQTILRESVRDERLERIEQQISRISNTIGKLHSSVDLVRRRELAGCEPEVMELFNRLISSGVSEENALKVIDEAERLSKEQETSVKLAAQTILCRYLGKSFPVDLEESKKKVIFFVGPTGVGKTTTLAKLAAVFLLQHGMKIGIITGDTFRIGAVEQLRIYADILSVPLEVIYSPEEITEKIDALGDVDLILVDTVGANTRDQKYHRTIKTMMDSVKSCEVHVVISATTEYSTAVQILESYSFLKDFKIIFTKLDECEKWGAMFNIKMLTDKPLSYITNGQNVAEDIMLADPVLIANKLIGM